MFHLTYEINTPKQAVNDILWRCVSLAGSAEVYLVIGIRPCIELNFCNCKSLIFFIFIFTTGEGVEAVAVIDNSSQ